MVNVPAPKYRVVGTLAGVEAPVTTMVTVPYLAVVNDIPVLLLIMPPRPRVAPAVAICMSVDVATLKLAAA